jgi:hypothetical protein
MATSKTAENALRQRFERIFSAIHSSRFGRWLFGINVVIAMMMAGAISVGVIFVALVEREIVGGVLAGLAAFLVSMMTNAYESYQRTKRPSSNPVLKQAIKTAYRDAVERSNLCKR